MVMLDGEKERLRKIAQGSGFGLLIIVDRPGDVAFAASPVPDLVGYEFVSASPDGKYDIWKDGGIERPGLTVDEVREFIKNRTPVWLYDDSPVNELDKSLVLTWAKEFENRYGVKLSAPKKVQQ